jgi:3-(3-hydroxy-phenyl)propionate hydroxylase
MNGTLIGMDKIIETDVLVIGAGPIGLAAANLLADQGVNVMLVERHAGTSDEPRAISVTDETAWVMQIGTGQLAPEMPGHRRLLPAEGTAAG